MADEKNDIESVMEAAWNETMGEAAKELPDDFSHLGGEPPVIEAKAETPAAAPATTKTDTQATEPVNTETKVVETGTPATPEPAAAPQHWSETDKATFAKLDKEGQSFLLKRHKEMEADYTRKTQENAEAVKLGSVVTRNLDPAIQAELRQTGVTPEKFVENLIGYHRMSVENPVELIRTLMTNLGVDAAKLTGVQATVQPGQADPNETRIQMLERFVNTEVQTRQQAVAEDASKTIEQVSTEKDTEGNLLRPHFDKVKTTMARLMSIDPDMDLVTAYDVAVYRDPELRPSIMQRVAAPAAVVPSAAPVPLDMDKVRKGEQAANAAKNVIRGNGATPTEPGKVKKMSLADALASAANEVGLT